MSIAEGHRVSGAVSAFRVDSDLHELLKNAVHRRDEAFYESDDVAEGGLPQPIYPPRPENAWPTDRKYYNFKAWRSWKDLGRGVAYFQSRFRPGQRRPLIAYLFTEWAITFVLLTSTALFAQGVQPTPDPDQGSDPAAAIVTAPQVSQHERAKQELKEQERQRIMGIVPNFNTTNIQDAVPLSTGQKFQLAFRSAVDPFQVVAAGLDAGISQWQNDFAGYGRGGQGYAKRLGAAYADQFSGAILGNGVFPALLHEDPRYFRKGEGSFKHRLLYSIAATVRTKNDNGTWGPNFSNVLGNIAAGGLSNFYYPASDRGLALTFERAATVTAEGAIGGVFVEFWPDISQKLFHRKSKP